MSARPHVLDFNDVMRAAFKQLGITGQVDVRFDGNRSTFWIGEPSPGARLITIEVKGFPPDEPAAARPA